MNMFIKKLLIEEDGEITVSRSFSDALTVVEGEKCELIQSVIKSVLGYGASADAYPYIIRFFAEVDLGKIFYIRGSVKEKAPIVQLQVNDADGKDCTEAYYGKLQQSAEERSVNCFSDFKRQKYPHRLYRYKDFEKYYPDGAFSKRTNGFGVTRCFRSFINQYIKAFQPVRLHSRKEFRLHLLPNGQFVVKNRNGPENLTLSESENTLYHYLCFLYLAEFWSAAETMRNFNHINKPLIIADFLERIDQSVDVSEILRRTAQINRQVFLLKRNLPCGS